MRVPFIDLPAQWDAIGAEIMAAIEPVLRSARFVMGPAVAQFEEEAAAYCEAKHAIGCGNGTEAILLALMAHGIGPGDEVIVPSFTFFATAAPVSRLGGIPVFGDVSMETFNLLPSEIERLRTDRTKAVIPVHQYGQPCELEEIHAICGEHGLLLIEDAAQAIGSRYKGRRIGSDWGSVATYSFFPSKNLSAMGDGGMMTTNDDELAHKLRLLRVHGSEKHYYHEMLGINSRLDSIQAAALSIKLRYLDQWNEARRRNATRYDDEFAGVDGIVTPTVLAECESNLNLYTVRILDGQRDRLRLELAGKDIGVETYWPVPLHLQECFADLGYKRGDLPNSEQLCEEVLSLPVYPEMTVDQQGFVIESIKAAL
ncbi:MAG: DegT/DnrJ/EryC1/StrS family aminotransferase [bacterium]|nr:DegT/DnrJ/EryC1/StrS family aminotransferase [bacterium]